MPVSLPKVPPGRVTSLVLAALGTLAVGIVGPIISSWYTERIAVELQLLAQSALVDGASELEKLQVTYDKRLVSGLSRVELNLVNTGRKSIRAGDVVSPITIAVDSGRILDVRTEQLIPLDLQVSYRFDPSRRSLTMAAPLLNPGDGIRFTLLVEYTPPPRVSASARIVGLHAITLTDRRPEMRSIWSAIAWPAYPASLGAAVALLALIFFSYVGGYAHRTRHVWRFRHAFVSSTPTPQQYAQALELTFGSDPGLEASVRPILDNLPPARPIPPPQLEILTRSVEKHVRDVRVSSYWIMLALFALFVVGSTYALSAIVGAARGLGG